MKKIISLVLAAALMLTALFAFTGCAKEDNVLVCGVTPFPNMNEQDENGNWTGFESEFAMEVGKLIDMEVKFQLIDWGAKETELKSKTIDCIWNGMTITPERAEAMSISTPYMANKQVLVVRAENADKYTTAEALKGVKVVAEQGSAGEEVITTEAFFAEAEYTPVLDQATALKEVWAGTEEACVVDYVTSIGMIGEGTDYADLVVVEGIAFADEQYGIAFRQGSDITAEVNAAITKLVENGTLAEIAEKYKLQDQIIAK